MAAIQARDEPGTSLSLITHELRKIFEVVPSGEAICVMMAFGAFRPEVFGNVVAADALIVALFLKPNLARE